MTQVLVGENCKREGDDVIAGVRKLINTVELGYYATPEWTEKHGLKPEMKSLS